MTYKYTHPYHWLSSKIEEMAANNDVDGLKAIALQLGNFLDGDTIQDEFESEMDNDGYFTEVAE
jgi:hypothetical protein